MCYGAAVGRPIVDRLASGDALVGVVVKMPAPGLIEQCGHAGIDLIVIDTEHGQGDGDALEHHLRAADSASVAALVRVGANDPLLILRTLDAGAAGVIVPHVSSAAEAERAVRAAHYPPIGDRGIALTTRDGRQGASTLVEHIDRRARETIVIVQIEDTAGIDQAKAIAETAHVTAVWIGPNDLSVSMGRAGDIDHPDVQAAIGRGVAAIRESNVPLCWLVTSEQDARAWLERGARIILFTIHSLLAERLRVISALAAIEVRQR